MSTKTKTAAPVVDELAQAKADALLEVAAAFDQMFHTRMSGTEVAKVLRAAAADALEPTTPVAPESDEDDEQ